MGIIKNVENWADVHHPIWLDLIRISLGVFIFTKGIYFAHHQDILFDMMPKGFGPFIALLMSHYVFSAHIVGGFLIAIGLITRIACLFQIPVLLGAVFFINMNLSFMGTEHIISVGVLLLMVIFLIYGSGRLSVDDWIEHHPSH